MQLSWALRRPHRRALIRSYSHFMSHYFAFVALVAVLVLIPGPAVILVMQKAMTTLLMSTSVMPQFIPAGSSPVLPALLGVTFAGLGFASLTAYSLVLGRAGGVLRRPQSGRVRDARSVGVRDQLGIGERRVARTSGPGTGDHGDAARVGSATAPRKEPGGRRHASTGLSRGARVPGLGQGCRRPGRQGAAAGKRAERVGAARGEARAGRGSAGLRGPGDQ